MKVDQLNPDRATGAPALVLHGTERVIPLSELGDIRPDYAQFMHAQIEKVSIALGVPYESLVTTWNGIIVLAADAHNHVSWWQLLRAAVIVQQPLYGRFLFTSHSIR